ncbi:MAG: hypothetical protein L6R37_007903 [Teloschistes peruensis]|nr:MAG: hypothetical protein L6R37_007903 [Teloschistes peruensis]
MAKMLDGPPPLGAKSVSWPWYHHVITNELTPDAKKLLTTYSGIPLKDLEAHIYSMRDKAWGIFPWPCVGEFWFLSFGLAKHPLYRNMVIPRLKAGQTLLDIGTCLGQDLRKCVFDGAPADNLFASDLFPEYEELAWDLFRDRDKIPPGHFFADNILAENEIFTSGPLMARLGPGQVDIITITMFLHLFNYENQLKTATRILRLLSQKPGSIILGSQAGSIDFGEQTLKPPFHRSEDGSRRTVYRHNPESFERLWKEAGKVTGVPLKVSAVLQSPTDFLFAADSSFDYSVKKRRYLTRSETRRLYFSIMRT